VPAVTALRAPAPNPVVAGSNVTFSLRNAGRVELDVYTVSGRLASRIAGGWYEAGDHTVAWQRRGVSGEPLANGVYIVRFRSGEVERTQKMVLAR
jgi:flagellar hook assembly protein FlgD